VQLRDYQQRSIKEVFGHWKAGRKNVCLVLPTAAGKTFVAAEIVARARVKGVRVVAVAHRREIVGQMLKAFGDEAAAICPGFKEDPSKPIQVATIQTLLSRKVKPKAGMFIWDETHHQPASGWSKLMDDYPDAYSLGLTATPMRSDGKALNHYDALVVGAQYSELVSAGHLVECRVFQAVRQVKGLAAEPLQAYQDHGRGKKAFVFCTSVDHCYEVAGAFNAAGITSAVIEAETHPKDREQNLELFRRGFVQCIMNVYTMTEGVNIPSAEVCILARSVGNAGNYLQMVGRVLRPSKDKDEARLLDLSGASLVFGLPTIDRTYSLDGEAIRPANPGERPLRVCMKCGYTYCGVARCPECGYESVAKRTMPRIYDVALREVWAGSDTAAQAKVAELLRLRRVAWERDYSVSWVVKRYREVFSEKPVMALFSAEERKREYRRLVALGLKLGYRRGFAYARYKSVFGTNPERGWQ
jgi:superfamily II DNA or RNA helicase